MGFADDLRNGKIAEDIKNEKENKKKKEEQEIVDSLDCFSEYVFERIKRECKTVVEYEWEKSVELDTKYLLDDFFNGLYISNPRNVRDVLHHRVDQSNASERVLGLKLAFEKEDVNYLKKKISDLLNAEGFDNISFIIEDTTYLQVNEAEYVEYSEGQKFFGALIGNDAQGYMKAKWVDVGECYHFSVAVKW